MYLFFYAWYTFFFFFFFFQAEDGIRDHCVTGVQTCALPILSSRAVTQERNDAAKQRDEPETEYGDAQKGVKHLVPDLLVGRPLIGHEGKEGWHEQPPKPKEPGEIGRASCRERE